MAKGLLRPSPGGPAATPDTTFMIFYALWLWWVGTRGYRLRPWRSPWMRWRIETYSGIPAEHVTFGVFWHFLWKERRELWRFLEWGARMRKLEQYRREAEKQWRVTSDE